MSLREAAFSALRPIDVVYSQWDFRAFSENQVTVAQGETLLLLPESPNDDWATVRKIGKPGANPASSGLVPKSYLKPQAQAFRGYALYTYKPDKPECVRMFIGRKVSVYRALGEWVLVKVDASGRGTESIGYVLKSYVKRFENTSDREYLGPSALNQLPESYCCLCEDSVVSEMHFECTQCRLPNGDPLLICRECAYFRQALFAHQGVNGQNHLFDIRNTMFNCDGCMKLLNGTDFFYCIACRHDKGNGYELCAECHRGPRGSAHPHSMSLVTKNCRLTEAHAFGLRQLKVICDSYTCNGCKREVSGCVLHCRVCPPAGFDVCLECAEIDRAAFLHDRWTRGAPHDFEIGLSR